jgi:dTDP-4-amino-4,6-dideoxygalactose transaminase
LTIAKAQWMLGRPSLYALPSAIPGLHLGETIYHPAREPREITGVSASLVREALVRADADLAVRTAHARFLEQAAAGAKGLLVIRPITGATPGYLRFPVRLTGERNGERLRPELGLVHGYPRTLGELPELSSWLTGEESLTGARELARDLITLPTHSLLTQKDLRAIRNWLLD